MVDFGIILYYNSICVNLCIFRRFILYISVLDWLDETAKKFPEKPAFFDDKHSVSFSRFQEITKSIGTCLASRIPAGSPVVCMSGRHCDTPAYFLSIVRAGCFYAPIDSTMPDYRLRQMISVVDAKYMLVDRENYEKATQLGFDGEIFIAEDMADTPADEALLSKARENMNEQAPLYVIFTSGSTGVPKGVITSHQSLMCYIDAVSEVLEVDETDVFGGQAPLDYIAAVRDIYLPLYTGASTVIIPKNIFSMPNELFSMLNEYKVTALCWSVAGVSLPAKLNAFSESKPEYLKKVVFSGSVMPGKYLRIWQDALPEVTYINQYGPTEATASCTYHIVDEIADDATVLPIGKPYKHYSVTVITPDGKKADVGETGEICVSGPCLALGYYGNAEKTAQSFVQNPLNSNFRELIYKTGDIGSFDENGVLHFHGRADRQIKHMGHRIELEEIESTAKAIEGVSDCCSLYQKEKELLYLFYTGEADKKAISLYFRANLPAFMSPRKIIPLEELPTLPNGKIDMTTLKSYFK